MDPLVLVQVLNVVYAVLTLALVVLGLAIVFGFLGVMNMAHGEFVMLGAYCVIAVQQAGLPFLAAVPLALAVCGALGYLVERIMIRHLYRRPFDTLLATWGLGILIRKLVEAVFGREYKSVEPVLQGAVVAGEFRYPLYRIVLMILVVVGFAALALWYRRSNTGTRIRAMVGNPDLAQAVGIRTGRLATATFVTGLALAGLAGVMLSPLVRVEPFMGIDYLLESFFVLVVGGLGSLLGLAIGAGLIGGIQSGVAAIIDQTAGYFSVLVIAILFLWLKPRGLVSRP